MMMVTTVMMVMMVEFLISVFPCLSFALATTTRKTSMHSYCLAKGILTQVAYCLAKGILTQVALLPR